MKYYSTKNRKRLVSFKDAVLNGIAPDGGLYLPDEIPVLDKSWIESLSNLSFQKISYDVAKIFVDNI